MKMGRYINHLGVKLNLLLLPQEGWSPIILVTYFLVLSSKQPLEIFKDAFFYERSRMEKKMLLWKEDEESEEERM